MIIDIKKINQIFFNLEVEYSNAVGNKIGKIFGRGFFYGVSTFILHFIESFCNSSFKFKEPQLSYTGILFFGLTRNNQVVLNNISKRFNEDEIIQITKKKHFPKWKVYAYSINHLRDTMRVYNNSTKDEQIIIKTYFYTFWITFGTYKLMEEMLDIYKPKVVVLANDHNTAQRSILEIANKRGIKTVYVQHASVTEKFPPLSFTHSFLDGRETLDKYLKTGSNKGAIYLSGGVRFDDIKPESNTKDTNKSDCLIIGIAINQLDNTELVKELSIKLNGITIDNKLVKIVLRPHPSSSSHTLYNWCILNNIGYSFSHKETSFDFLRDIDLLISNESSIHLDAVMSRKPTLLYDFTGKQMLDWYGYERNGLVKKVNSFTEIIHIFENTKDLMPSDELVQYYVASFKTKHEGKVSNIVAELIRDILSNNTEFFDEKAGFTTVYEDCSKSVKIFVENYYNSPEDQVHWLSIKKL